MMATSPHAGMGYGGGFPQQQPMAMGYPMEMQNHTPTHQQVRSKKQRGLAVQPIIAPPPMPTIVDSSPSPPPEHAEDMDKLESWALQPNTHVEWVSDELKLLEEQQKILARVLAQRASKEARQAGKKQQLIDETIARTRNAAMQPITATPPQLNPLVHWATQPGTELNDVASELRVLDDSVHVLQRAVHSRQNTPGSESHLGGARSGPSSRKHQQHHQMQFSPQHQYPQQQMYAMASPQHGQPYASHMCDASDSFEYDPSQAQAQSRGPYAMPAQQPMLMHSPQSLPNMRSNGQPSPGYGQHMFAVHDTHGLPWNGGMQSNPASASHAALMKQHMHLYGSATPSPQHVQLLGSTAASPAHLQLPPHIQQQQISPTSATASGGTSPSDAAAAAAAAAAAQATMAQAVKQAQLQAQLESVALAMKLQEKKLLAEKQAMVESQRAEEERLRLEREKLEHQTRLHQEKLLLEQKQHAESLQQKEFELKQQQFQARIQVEMEQAKFQHELQMQLQAQKLELQKKEQELLQELQERKLQQEKEQQELEAALHSKIIQQQKEQARKEQELYAQKLQQEIALQEQKQQAQLALLQQQQLQRQREMELAQQQAQREMELAQAQAQREMELQQLQKQREIELQQQHEQKELELAKQKQLLLEATQQKQRELELQLQKQQRADAAAQQQQKELELQQQQKQRELELQQQQQQKQQFDLEQQQQQLSMKPAATDPTSQSPSSSTMSLTGLSPSSQQQQSSFALNDFSSMSTTPTSAVISQPSPTMSVQSLLSQQHANNMQQLLVQQQHQQQQLHQQQQQQSQHLQLQQQQEQQKQQSAVADQHSMHAQQLAQQQSQIAALKAEIEASNAARQRQESVLAALQQPASQTAAIASVPVLPQTILAPLRGTTPPVQKSPPFAPSALGGLGASPPPALGASNSNNTQADAVTKLTALLLQQVLAPSNLRSNGLEASLGAAAGLSAQHSHLTPLAQAALLGSGSPLPPLSERGHKRRMGTGSGGGGAGGSHAQAGSMKKKQVGWAAGVSNGGSGQNGGLGPGYALPGNPETRSLSADLVLAATRSEAALSKHVARAAQRQLQEAQRLQALADAEREERQKRDEAFQKRLMAQRRAKARLEARTESDRASELQAQLAEVEHGLQRSKERSKDRSLARETHEALSIARSEVAEAKAAALAAVYAARMAAHAAAHPPPARNMVPNPSGDGFQMHPHVVSQNPYLDAMLAPPSPPSPPRLPEVGVGRGRMRVLEGSDEESGTPQKGPSRARSRSRAAIEQQRTPLSRSPAPGRDRSPNKKHTGGDGPANFMKFSNNGGKRQNILGTFGAFESEHDLLEKRAGGGAASGKKKTDPAKKKKSSSSSSKKSRSKNKNEPNVKTVPLSAIAGFRSNAAYVARGGVAPPINIAAASAAGGDDEYADESFDPMTPGRPAHPSNHQGQIDWEHGVGAIALKQASEFLQVERAKARMDETDAKRLEEVRAHIALTGGDILASHPLHSPTSAALLRAATTRDTTTTSESVAAGASRSHTSFSGRPTLAPSSRELHRQRSASASPSYRGGGGGGKHSRSASDGDSSPSSARSTSSVSAKGRSRSKASTHKSGRSSVASTRDAREKNGSSPLGRSPSHKRSSSVTFSPTSPKFVRPPLPDEDRIENHQTIGKKIKGPLPPPPLKPTLSSMKKKSKKEIVKYRDRAKETKKKPRSNSKEFHSLSPSSNRSKSELLSSRSGGQQEEKDASTDPSTVVSPVTSQNSSTSPPQPEDDHHLIRQESSEHRVVLEDGSEEITTTTKKVLIKKQLLGSGPASPKPQQSSQPTPVFSAMFSGGARGGVSQPLETILDSPPFSPPPASKRKMEATVSSLIIAAAPPSAPSTARSQSSFSKTEFSSSYSVVPPLSEEAQAAMDAEADAIAEENSRIRREEAAAAAAESEATIEAAAVSRSSPHSRESSHAPKSRGKLWSAGPAPPSRKRTEPVPQALWQAHATNPTVSQVLKSANMTEEDKRRYLEELVQAKKRQSAGLSEFSAAIGASGGATSKRTTRRSAGSRTSHGHSDQSPEATTRPATTRATSSKKHNKSNIVVGVGVDQTPISAATSSADVSPYAGAIHSHQRTNSQSRIPFYPSPSTTASSPPSGASNGSPMPPRHPGSSGIPKSRPSGIPSFHPSPVSGASSSKYLMRDDEKSTYLQSSEPPLEETKESTSAHVGVVVDDDQGYEDDFD